MSDEEDDEFEEGLQTGDHHGGYDGDPFDDILDNGRVGRAGEGSVSGPGRTIDDFPDPDEGIEESSIADRQETQADSSIFTFEIQAENKDAIFRPFYFPESFRSDRSRDIEGKIDACKQELLIFKYIEGSRIHASGITFLEGRNEGEGLQNFQEAVHNLHDSRVELTCNLLEEGSLPCYVEDSEFGDFAGYDAKHKQYLIEYTVDLISLGREGAFESEGVVDEINLGGE